jgi:Fe-S-cluster containining protein
MDNWKKTILNEFSRLAIDSKFKFSCHNGLTCFGSCCANVNIFLTPYDVLRMKKALNMSSQDFLEKYTLPLVLQDQQIPVALLKMGDDEQKKCPLVSSEGCTIYNDRPWACRMYPLGLASSKTETGGEEFCFIVGEESHCMGFKEDKEWTVKQWFDDQDVGVYNNASESYMRLTLHKWFADKKELGPEKVERFYKTCYDLDGFREHIFESNFLNLFNIDDELLEKIKVDDEELMNFAMTWLRFALFGENTIQIKDEVLEKRKNELGLTNQ